MLSDLVSIYIHAYFVTLFVCLIGEAYKAAKLRQWSWYVMLPMVVGTAMILFFIYPVLTLMALDQDRKETR